MVGSPKEGFVPVRQPLKLAIHNRLPFRDVEPRVRSWDGAFKTGHVSPIDLPG